MTVLIDDGPGARKATMRDTYKRLRRLDDGLPPIETTNLLSPTLWT